MSLLSTTLYELFADDLVERADRIAIIDRDEPVTYGALAQRVDALAEAITRAGVQRGDRVAIHLRKSVDEVAAIIAAAKLATVSVNINAQWTLDQLAYVVTDCDPRLILTDSMVVERARRIRPELVSRMLATNDIAAEHCGAITAAAPLLDTALATILYTSGSTGMPKGVMLSHRNILAGARATARYLKLGRDERLLGVLPYSFDYGLNQLTSALLMGGTIVHQTVPMPMEIIRTLQRHAVTGVAAVPPLWAQLVRLLDTYPVPLPALRRITNSGGAIAPDILERISSAFPDAEIYLMYGLTEAFRSTYLPPEHFQQKKGSIGRAIPGADIYVIRNGIGIAGPGEQGELVHRGPMVSLGYWGKPDATQAKIHPCPELAHLIGDEPVVYSGDIVRIDADGDLWFVGREDAMIKTRGFRVSPEEIEAAVSQSGLVAEVVAFGRPDDDLGQVIEIAVSPLEVFSEAALNAHCRRIMPHYMIPRAIHVWQQAMPRTASGKLNRPDVISSCAGLTITGAAKTLR